MNNRIIAPLFLISVLSLCCAPKPEPQEGTFELKIEGDVDPNTLAVVTLELDGETLPGSPKVVSANDTSAAFFERVGTPEYVQQIAQNKWVAILTPGQSYVVGWIVPDNKLFGYCSDPFVAENNLGVSFSPGMPASLEYDLSSPEEGVEVFPAVFLLSRKADKIGGFALMSWGATEELDEPKVVRVDGLAQGTYQIFAQDLNGQNFVEPRTRFLYDKRFIEIKPAEVKRIEAQYPVLDTTVEDGDVTIRGRMHNSAGEFLADETINLIPHEGKSQRLDLYYNDTVTDSNGYFEFKGVRPDISVSVRNVGGSINLKKDTMTRGASLWVDFLTGVLNVQMDVNDTIPEFKLEWKDGQDKNLLEYVYGKTAVVEVWTSWCPTSQKSLAELDALAQEYRDDPNVTFAAMSIDASRDDWEKAVDKLGLNAVRQCLYVQDNSFAFNRPIPFYIVIDEKGIIRAAGNSIDVRAELKKALGTSE